MTRPLLHPAAPAPGLAHPAAAGARRAHPAAAAAGLAYHAAFAAGLLAIAWVAAGYLAGNPLALALVLVIAAAYLLGAVELRRFGRDTAALAHAVAQVREAPPALEPWLAALPDALRHAVRLRVAGERVALPGPALTPYLVGLLVLLGMLGTFLGMVATLKGTGLALENASDVEAIRASLAAPVKGLGLAFGCSVAGVAASAMLGLMSALARRERQAAVRRLDEGIAGPLRGFSRAQQRDEALRLLQAQTAALTAAGPAILAQLEGLVAQMQQQGQALQDGLLAGQARAQGETQRAYAGLAESVDRSLRTSLVDSARLAGATIEPAVQATLAGLARETATLREALAAAAHEQLQGMTARLDTHNAALLDGMTARLDEGAARWAGASGQALAGFEQHAAALLRGAAEAQTALEAAADTRERERLHAFHAGLSAMADTLQRQHLAAAAATAAREQQVCATLERSAQAVAAQAQAQARATLDELGRLAQAAAQAPQAAAEVIAEMRGAHSASLLRDNAALDERNRLLDTLGRLLDAVNHASTEQRAAIDALVQATGDVLQRAGERFAGTVEAESRVLHTAAAQVQGSAVQVAGLGEGFGAAVQLFSGASQQLLEQLARIEAALGHSMTRSDEQLAYYVAQAREIVDLTLGSQRQIVEDLQQLGRAPATAA